MKTYIFIAIVALCAIAASIVFLGEDESLTQGYEPGMSADQFTAVVDKNFAKLPFERQYEIYQGVSFESQEKIRRFWWAERNDSMAATIVMQ